jgi:hypothetical protein
MESFRQLSRGVTLQTPDQAHGIWKKWLSSHDSETTQLSRKKFWMKYLEELKTAPFQPRTAPVASVNTRTSLFQLGAFRDTAKLHATCAASGFSLQALFFAVYAKFLARSASSHDIVFGMYLANRTSMDGLDRLPYPTLSLVPLRVHQPASCDLVTIAKSVQADLYEISSPTNASVGLWQIFDWTGVKIDSFVNFLSLPDSHKNDGTDGIVLTKESDNDIEVQSQPSSGLSLKDQRLIKLNPVRDAYPVSSVP